MYSPYDEENNQITPPNSTDYYSPFRMLASGTALGVGALAVGGLGFAVRGTYNAMYRGNVFGMQTGINKLRGTDLYKGSVNPINSISYLSPKIGSVNSLDKGFYNLLGRNKTGRIGFNTRFGSPEGSFSFAGRYTKSSLIKLPVMAPLSALMTISNEFDSNNHASSLPIGMLREAGGILGGVGGQIAGVALGGLLGGVPGAMLGGVVGGIAGGMLGIGMPEILGKMKAAGRAWTTPDVGGSFKDSQMAQTMRARSLQVARLSQFNVRSSLGSESSRLVLGI